MLEDKIRYVLVIILISIANLKMFYNDMDNLIVIVIATTIGVLLGNADIVLSMVLKKEWRVKK